MNWLFPSKGVKSVKARKRRSNTPPPSQVPELKPVSLESELKTVAKKLVDCPWYHGIMPRQECEAMLKKTGDFIVRRTTVDNKVIYCVSVKRDDEVKHIPILFDDGVWHIKEIQANELKELIEKVMADRIGIGALGAFLLKGVQRPNYYILHEHVQTKKRIGAGAFGEVYAGRLQVESKNLLLAKAQADPEQLQTRSAETPTDDAPMAASTTSKSLVTNVNTIECAIKVIKGEVMKDKMVDFLREANLMRRFNHKNIVRIYGVAPQEEPLMIVLELAKGGGLVDYCKKNAATIKESRLLQFTTDAARGMCYLSYNQVIHRDLAARNCLLGKDLELKISDFGLSVADKNEVKLTKLKAVPVRWLSPETLLTGVFNQKTDVWSFGVLVWEIFSRCATEPFPGLSNVEARGMICGKELPMAAPAKSPDVIKQVMEACFTHEAANRPHFEKVLKMLAPDERPPQVEVPKEVESISIR